MKTDFVIKCLGEIENDKNFLFHDGVDFILREDGDFG